MRRGGRRMGMWSVDTTQKMEHNRPNITVVDEAAQDVCRFLGGLG